MRILTAAFLTAATLGTVMATTPAEAFDRRICLISSAYLYPGDCAYDTYAQCKATASGQQAYCGVNPNFAFAEAEGKKYRSTDGFNTTRFIFSGGRYR